VGVAARDERRRHAGLGAVQVDVDSREVLGVVSELDSPPDKGWVDAIGVALEGDCRRAGHPSRHRPPEGLSQLVGVDLAVGTGPLEAVDRASLVSACTRRLATCSAQAKNRSFSSSSEEMP